MARQRVIVSIGEALLCEYPDRVEAGGLALGVALAAVRAGHRGVAVSRVGQDDVGEQLLRQAREAGVDVDHIQSDPDLATGRMTVRSLAGRTTTTLSPMAAFDNLQWDFDLADVAQHADAVVFGQLARRGGQSRSVIKQFLFECRSAVRVFDVTNRAAETLERGEAWSGLEFAEVVIADAAALRALAPTMGEDIAAAASDLARSFRVQVVAVVERRDGLERFNGYSRESAAEMNDRYPIERHDRALVGFTSALLNGQSLEACLNEALRESSRSSSDQ